MATIKNYRDLQLQSTTPRLIHVPSNTITLIGTGNTFEVRKSVTQPPIITVTAIPQGHLINQACTFSLIATTGHTLSVPSVNTAVITGDVNGSDIITLQAQIVYQGLTYTSTYTINKLSPDTYVIYEVTTSVGSLVYDPNTTSYTPSTITIEAIYSEDGIDYLPYEGRFTIHVSTNGGTSWGTAIYSSSSNQSSYSYALTGVTTSTTHIRFRLHVADETPSDLNVLDVTTIPMITYGYSGSNSGGSLSRAVYIDIGSASTVSVYGMDGYIASSSNPVNPVTCNAITHAFESSQWYRWSVDDTVVSDWNTTNSSYTYYRQHLASDMPDILKVEVGDGYSGSNIHANDFVVFYLASGYTGSGSTITVALTNEYHTVSTDIYGETNYTNSGTSFIVYEGGTLLTFKGEGNTYPAVEDAGKYNVERTYVDLTSGGAMTGTGTTKGTVPAHTKLTGLQGMLILTFRVRKLDGTNATEITKTQFVYKSSFANNITIIAENEAPSFFTASNLPYVVDFTDLMQTFWPGDDYFAPLYTGSMTFGYKFSGMSTTTISGSNFSYIGSQIYVVLNGLPKDPLQIVSTVDASYVIGVACDPMDHPVLFGREPYTPV